MIDIESFRRNGWVRVQHAFDRDDAFLMQERIWATMADEHGVDRHDRSTWCVNAPLRMHRTKNDPLFSRMATIRMMAAMDTILPDIPTPDSWGGFLITFPSGRPLSEWQIPTAWHWDGSPADHLGGLRSVMVFSLFSQIEPGGGGTLLLSGSHKLIDRFVETVPEGERSVQRPMKEAFAASCAYLRELNGLDPVSGDRTRRFMEEEQEIDGVPVQVVEITGEPGDVYLCHPSLYHAVAPNHRSVPRFMRVKPVGMG